MIIKEVFMKIFVLMLTVMFTVSCGSKNTTGSGVGFEGPISIELVLEDDIIKDIILTEGKDTACLLDRAFPVIKERIIAANTPLVDSVSGATYTSFGVKMAVANALKAAGKEAPKITIKSQGEVKPDTIIDDVTVDLLIVGGGPAGLSSAITAFENGISNIILIEKLDILSGNGKFDKNFFDMVDSQGQKKSGIEDSADKFYADMIKRHKGDDTNRLRVLADYSATTDEWLRKYGVKLDFVSLDTTAETPRSHQVSEDIYAGNHIQTGLEKGLSNTTVDVRTGTEGLDLVMDGQTVKGIRVKNRDNQSYTIFAKAVIIATGGFSANKELLAKHGNKVASAFITSNQEKNIGDFIPVFEKNNIAIDNMDILSIFSYTVVKNRALTGSSESDVDFILVNKEAQRFMKEKGLPTPQFANNMLAQTDQMAYYVFDDTSRAAGPRIRAQIKKEYGTTADSIEELAKKLKLDPVVFAQTIEDYRKITKKEMEDPFQKTVFKREFATKGPFFAIAVRPAIHMTKGGVVVNAKGEVQSKAGTSVKGLYAAGEVTSIIDGAYMAAVALGRATGDQVSTYLKQ